MFCPSVFFAIRTKLVSSHCMTKQIMNCPELIILFWSHKLVLWVGRITCVGCEVIEVMVLSNILHHLCRILVRLTLLRPWFKLESGCYCSIPLSLGFSVESFVCFLNLRIIRIGLSLFIELS